MGKCNIDHSPQDVVDKLNSQKDYLSSDIFYEINGFLKRDVPQHDLNELFHLLKKYDLASAEEQLDRDKKINELIFQ